MRLKIVISLLLLALVSVRGQQLTGRVVDSENGEPVAWANVFYDGMPVGVNTDEQGRFKLPLHTGKTLIVSFIGYEKQTFRITNANPLDVKLKWAPNELKTAVVNGKKKKYSRKNNPAVELMKKVIKAKKQTDIHRHPYFSYNLYKKLTFSFNEVSEKALKEGMLKKMPFLENHVEICPETGKRILPITFQEETSRQIWRKNPETEKTIITGKREDGLNKFFTSGEILNSILADCFTDVDIYDDNVRLLRHQFISPISSKNAISFYRYFIMDTTYVEGDKCIEVTFTPNNPQDFGFSGSLFIMADSTYRVRRSRLLIPHSSDVNFVEQLNVDQEFLNLPTGDQVLESNKMTVQLSAIMDMARMQVQLSNRFTDYSLEPIADKEFRFGGTEMTDPNAELRDQKFWTEMRTDSLTKAEADMGQMVKEFQQMKHFNVFLFVFKAFVENYVETSSDPKKPSLIDIGPVNTIFSQNFVDGFRLRASAQTTANLHPHLFAKGYVAYGFKDHRMKGMGELTYAFKKRAYSAAEFPLDNLSASFQSDVMSPSDKFLPTDKDNVFTSFKVKTVDQMMYYTKAALKFQREWANGFGIDAQLQKERDEGVGALFYQSLNGSPTPTQDIADHYRFFNTTDLRLGVSYSPGAKYVNTKQRRILVNNEAPIFTLYHTMGLKAMGGEHAYHFTEATAYKRVWLPSAWGRMDFYLKAGAQWSKVPYPLLIMPAANLSYVVHKGTFCMVNNMEFLNDRYASLMINWDLNGKVFNRIPLLRKLKWREVMGVNALWGSLSDKNNPWLNPNDKDLYYFPGHFNREGRYEFSSFLMEHKKPYVEVYAGVYNIFKVLQIQAVRRLNYLYLPHTKKWGWRVKLELTF
ncbi:MAG: carboxypeptidase-like regulatory domain-containing protein [Bacteroidaceae bacterium]|nr:carboxypeptidase-like regulatory domain-containing protein [Bacteroidaceae bacterium]